MSILWARNILSLCSIILSIPLASCHMEMSWPYPLRSKFNPQNNYTNIDYSMTTSLFADGSNFPCKGYQNDRPIQTTATYMAGSTYNMTLAGTATHGGGSCQLSLSYDNGATFRVIKSMIGGCPLQTTYDFTIPSCAPASKTALLAWSWQNLEGNREFYMNCAAVRIKSPRRKKTSQCRGAASFKKVPHLWKANLPGINNCTTTEQVNPVYPHPGSDVLYGGSISSSNQPSPGDCDAVTPYGQTYKYLGDTNQAAAAGQSYAVNSRRSIISPSYTATTSLPESHHSTLVVTSTLTIVPIPTAQTPIVISSPASPRYVGQDSHSYLPCVPGSFICTSNTTWETCDRDNDNAWAYLYPRDVSAGMECLPQLVQYSGTTWQYAQQSHSPNGYYRSDEIERARPRGDCSEEGAMRCSTDGLTFSVCDHGGWIDMGMVASGTICVNGDIVAHP